MLAFIISWIHSIRYFWSSRMNLGCLCRLAACLISFSQGSFGSQMVSIHLLGFLGIFWQCCLNKGALCTSESYRCRGFCMMSEGSAINAFLKGNVYKTQCRPPLKLSQPYFPRFRWLLDPGSPNPILHHEWLFYIRIAFFPYHMIMFQPPVC